MINAPTTKIQEKINAIFYFEKGTDSIPNDDDDDALFVKVIIKASTTSLEIIGYYGLTELSLQFIMKKAL